MKSGAVLQTNCTSLCWTPAVCVGTGRPSGFLCSEKFLVRSSPIPVSSAKHSPKTFLYQSPQLDFHMFIRAASSLSSCATAIHQVTGRSLMSALHFVPAWPSCHGCIRKDKQAMLAEGLTFRWIAVDDAMRNCLLHSQLNG